MNAYAQSTIGNGRTVRDVLVAKAIKSGYNPYCRSTDAGARRVTEDMRAKAQYVAVPENKALSASSKRNSVREVAPSSKEMRPRREAVAIENFEIVRRRGATLSLGMLVSVMVTAIVLAMVVFSGSRINEEARRYSELSDTLAVLQEEDKNLTLALEEKNDLTVIEDVAQNELGMVKVASAEQKYVSLSDGNSVNVYANAADEASVPMHLLNTFGEKVNGFLEYLD